MRTDSLRPTGSSPSPGRMRRKKSGMHGARAPVLARNALEVRALQSFRTIFGSARRFDAEVRKTTGISGSLLWALSEIEHTASMSVNALAERMALHQTTTSNIVNALAERRLIHRTRSAADQRVVCLRVSALGARILRRAPGPHAGLLVDALRRVTGSQIELLEKSLSLVIAEMRGTAAIAAGETLLGE